MGDRGGGGIGGRAVAEVPEPVGDAPRGCICKGHRQWRNAVGRTGGEAGHIGDDVRTMTIWKELFDAGIFVNPVISPAVPEGSQLLRTSYMATHTDEQLARVLQTFAKVGKDVGLIS